MRKLPQTIVILSAQPRALVAAEHFLVNRGWSVRIFTDETEALREVLEQNPSFFFVSIEHPNTKFRDIHVFFKTARPELCVVYFVEKNNMENYRALTRMDHFYRVPPPITGPAMERAVNRHLKELRQQQQAQEVHARKMNPLLDTASHSLDWAPVSDTQSLLARGVLRVLEDSSARSRVPLRERLEGKTKKAICIAIETAGFAGYLVAAMAGDQSLDQAYVNLVRTRLRQYLRDNGAVVKEDDSFAIDLREVPFERFARSRAEFVKKTIHDGAEVAVAYFATAPLLPGFQVIPVAEDRARIHVKDLVGDTRVDFDVFVYLPANQREILYTRKDGMFFASQKARLTGSHTLQLRVRRDDLAAFSRYRVRHQLDEMIHEFESEKNF